MRHLSLLALTALVLVSVPTQAQSRNANLESLTADNSVILYVDYLSGLDDYLTTVPGKQFRNNVTAFLKLHSIYKKVPVAVLGDESAYAGRFYPEVRQYAGDAKYFNRTTPTGLTPEVAAWLKKTGRKKVIIGGISIDNCTLHTTLDLLRAGYDVHVVADVSSTNNTLSEETALTRLSRAGAVLTSWVTVSTELLKDWNSPEGKELMKLMGAHLKSSTVGEPSDPSADMSVQ
ncbi:MAG TPA: isochorismatase family protein [Archangium sp.]|uniref:isochorismatase family protein n=1 Tax=Archangium sp. TaxID=1872627 RepID=UPI002E309F56|nr:isochorismatase family protein [Archangium sp.]HEX5749335.1 isochorismatase family protein [Archangium sp.]